MTNVWYVDDRDVNVDLSNTTEGHPSSIGCSCLYMFVFVARFEHEMANL